LEATHGDVVNLIYYETTVPASFTTSTIDGSINNTVTGVVEATALVNASLATATEFTLPTMDFGDMATTASYARKLVMV
jgi:hypothetical protein